MKRILFAALLAAAPAFADRYDRPDDDQAARQGDWSGGYDEEQYDWPASDGSEGNYEPADDLAYTEDRGPTLDDFRNDRELTWNGEWIDSGEYGRVWRPTHVNDDWQPYLYGRWVWTRAGWAWASDEPFGWAVYHYGRWAWAPAVGWMWVPGHTWAPAWVSWRWTDGYAAWCPLGPRAAFVDRPALWVVVPTRRFLEPVRHSVVPRGQRQALPLPSRPGPRAGPAVTVVERAIGHTVHPLAIGHAANPSAARMGSGSVDFYRPRTAPIPLQPRVATPSQAEPQRTTPDGARRGRPTGYYASPPSAQEQPPQAVPHGPRAGRPYYGPPPASTQGQASQAAPPENSRRPYYGPPPGSARPEPESRPHVGAGAPARPPPAQPPGQPPRCRFRRRKDRGRSLRPRDRSPSSRAPLRKGARRMRRTRPRRSRTLNSRWSRSGE